MMDRVTNIAWKTEGGVSLGGFAYGYDALGRIVSRDHELGGESFDRAYSYDDRDRLASDGDVAYIYDAAGNRMARTEDGTTTTYTLGVGDRLAAWTGGAYSYDAAGNVTRIVRDGRPTLDLAWNGHYQLVSVSTNGVFAEGYAYDALGRRVSTTTADGTKRHVYDDSWQVIADIDEQGNVVASYAWGEGIDRLLAVRIGGANYYPLTDIQGTVWGYVDSANNVVARWQYDAWGNVVDEAVSVPELASLRYRFQCREWSAATGLLNFRNRWYDAETGRWLSKDPIRLNGGLNLYCFCRCNPLNKRDPVGRSPDDKKEETGLWDRIKNWGKALLTASQSSLPTTSSTVVNALEGVPVAVPLGNQIDALQNAIDALDAGALETNDRGNVLRDSENTIRRCGSAIDDAVNM